MLGLVITIVQLASLVVFALSMHTMLSVFSSAIPSSEGEIELEMTDPVVIPFSLTPVNPGYLEAKLSITISLIVDGDIVIATDSTTLIIPPNSANPVDLELSIPLEDASKYLVEGANASWKSEISVSTLNDLVSFSNTIIMGGSG